MMTAFVLFLPFVCPACSLVYVTACFPFHWIFLQGCSQHLGSCVLAPLCVLIHLALKKIGKLQYNLLQKWRESKDTNLNLTF